MSGEPSLPPGLTSPRYGLISRWREPTIIPSSEVPWAERWARVKRKRSDRNETRMKQTVTKMKQLQPLPSYPLRFHCFLTASFLWLPRPSREGNSRASVSTLHSSVAVTVVTSLISYNQIRSAPPHAMIREWCDRSHLRFNILCFYFLLTTVTRWITLSQETDGNRIKK